MINCENWTPPLYTSGLKNFMSDVLLTLGHLIFEMSAGFELKQLAPGKDDYKTVNKSIIPILEFIFDEELSHSISDVSKP